MTAFEIVGWLNERDPFHEWRPGEVIRCFHCERDFKAEDVGRYLDDGEPLPCCPYCEATPLDFVRPSQDRF